MRIRTLGFLLVLAGACWTVSGCQTTWDNEYMREGAYPYRAVKGKGLSAEYQDPFHQASTPRKQYGGDHATNP